MNLKIALKLCFVATLILAVGCGKKNNKVSTNYASGSPFTSDNSALNSTAGSNMISQVQSLKNSVACKSGMRLTNDVSFYASSGSFTGSKLIAAGWTPGFMTSGTINRLWIGVSAFNDLMFVTQVTNGGSQVIGFNVTLSMCELKNSYPTLPSIISNTRELTNFRTPNGIVLDSDTYCGYSMVDAAINTYLTSRRDMSNSYYSNDAEIQTTFTKAACNGRW